MEVEFLKDKPEMSFVREADASFRDFSAYDTGHSTQTRLQTDKKTYRTPQFERYCLDIRQ